MTDPVAAKPAGALPPPIEVVPLGPVEALALSVVAANLQAIIGLLAEVAPPRPVPEGAIIASRQQFDAQRLLEALESNLPPGRYRIGILREDLCMPIFTYVLGEARVGGRVAVISLFRLKREPDGRPVSPDRLYERLAKVALHETAHLLGLRHCSESECLMSFSLGATQVDRLPLLFCPRCERLLRGACRGAR